MVENELSTLLKNLNLKVVSSRINTFVAAFFGTALGETITKQNVKTLRIRMKQQQ